MTTATCPPIVVTGASGFIGRRLLAALSSEGRQRGGAPRDALFLARAPEKLIGDAWWHTGWRVEQIDIASRDVLAKAWPRDATVIHLAAATGRLSPDAMQAMNVGGTRRLLDAARDAGARRFIFVSSVAARYPEQRWYPYAQSKREAESVVRASGIPFTIVRPTFVFGNFHGSVIEQGLTALATGAAPIVLGSGTVMTQPVHVDDVVALLIAVTESSGALGETLEVGGADRLTMRDLLARLRAARGLAPRRVRPVPLGIVRAVLGRIEPLLRPVLPVTSGQLAAFVNDSDAQPHPIVPMLLPRPRSLSEMLASEAKRG